MKKKINEMDKNIFKVVYKGKVEKETFIPVQNIDRELTENKKGTNIIRVNEEGTALMQVEHEFVNIGERIAQVQYNTAATLTERGTVVVSQFVKEVASRGEDVWYYKNSFGTFEGTLADAQQEFPDVDFTKLSPSSIPTIDHPELGKMPVISKPVVWKTINEYDGEKTGEAVSWDDWADATQTALDVVGLIPGVGEIADCINGVISLARGDYTGAALSFAAMIPFFGAAATVTKQAKKLKKIAKTNKETNEGVYDLIVKNKDDVENYIGKSKNIFQRFIQHFNPKRGKLATKALEEGSLFHKMKGATDEQMEIIENWIIIQKYGVNWKDLKKSGVLKKLLNKRNPVGGRFNFKSEKELEKFYERAEKIIDKTAGLRESLDAYLNNVN